MSLSLQAAADAKNIVESTAEFGWPITVTNPSGITRALVGLSSDVHLTMHPETGEAISGRRAHVTLVISTLLAANLGEPRGESDAGKKPWLVRFNDVNGRTWQSKIAQAIPDYKIGLIVCTLEPYRASP